MRSIEQYHRRRHLVTLQVILAMKEIMRKVLFSLKCVNITESISLIQAAWHM